MKRLYVFFMICIAGCILAIMGSAQIQSNNVLITKEIRAAGDTLRLTAPGDFPAIATAGYKYVTVAIKIVAINTSITFRFLGRNNKLGTWGNLDNDSDSTVIAVNRTLFKTYAYVGGIDSFKVEFTSEAGGTAAVPTLSYVLWNETPYGFDW